MFFLITLLNLIFIIYFLYDSFFSDSDIVIFLFFNIKYNKILSQLYN